MTASDVIVSDPEQVLGPLFESGWSLHSSEAETPDAILQEMVKLGDRLGTRVAGRAGQLGEVVEPIVAAEAHPRSLSARYGLGALPFHTELSHRPRPCRYLLLGCIDPGAPVAATMLLEWRRLGFAREELALLEEAPILVRNGRRSFYSTILAPGRAFLRYDPGCLEPLDERGRKAIQLVEDRATRALSYAHHWRRSDVLIIDNWRVLHGRSPSDNGSGRRLARILIDA